MIPKNYLLYAQSSCYCHALKEINLQSPSSVLQTTLVKVAAHLVHIPDKESVAFLLQQGTKYRSDQVEETITSKNSLNLK